MPVNLIVFLLLSSTAIGLFETRVIAKRTTPKSAPSRTISEPFSSKLDWRVLRTAIDWIHTASLIGIHPNLYRWFAICSPKSPEWNTWRRRRCINAISNAMESSSILDKRRERIPLVINSEIATEYNVPVPNNNIIIRCGANATATMPPNHTNNEESRHERQKEREGKTKLK